MRRHISLNGQPNFRDLGGYRATAGRFVKEGRLFRSGELCMLSDPDVATLEDLGIRTVVDFRSEAEVTARGVDRLPDDVNYVPLRVAPGELGGLLLEAIQTGDMSRIPDDILADANRVIISRATDQYSALFDLISRPKNLPLVFHCTHGKDRAGVASAVILMALGVPVADVREDYLLSNLYRREENERELIRLRTMVASRQGIDPDDIDLSKLGSIFYVQSSYFDAMLNAIGERHGSFEAYLEDGLGLERSGQAHLQELLTR